MTEIERRLNALQRTVDGLYDDRIRQRRMLADLLYNLDGENMPVIKNLIERYQRENTDAISALILQADENGAAIYSIASMQTEQAENIASISQKADANGAQIAIAAERAAAAESAASEVSSNLSNGAYIIARVNEDGSGIQISADKLELSGYTTFSDLENEGQTVINGGNVKANTLSVGALRLDENGQICFEKLGYLAFYDPAENAGGEIRLSTNEYGRAEIAVSSDGSVSLGGGSTHLLLVDDGSSANITANADAVRLYMQKLLVNNLECVSGTFALGNGSITVENGLIVGATSDEGGTGEPEPDCSEGHTLTYSSNDDAASHTVMCGVCGEVISHQEYCHDNDGTGYCSLCGQFIV